MSNSSASSAGGFGLAAGITSSEAETQRGSLRVSSTTETTQGDGSSSGGGSIGGAAVEGTTRSLSAVKEEAESGASPSGRGDQSLPPTSSSTSSWVKCSQSPLVGDGEPDLDSALQSVMNTPLQGSIITIEDSETEETTGVKLERLLGVHPSPISSNPQSTVNSSGTTTITECMKEELSDDDPPPQAAGMALPVPFAPRKPPVGLGGAPQLGETTNTAHHRLG